MDYYKYFQMGKNGKSMIIKEKMRIIIQKRKMIRKILKINILKIILVLEKNFLKVRPK